MRIVRIIRSIVTASACFGLLLPTSVLSAMERSNQVVPSKLPVVGDVALQAGGQLSGRILNADGQPAPNTTIELVDTRTGKRFDGEVDQTGRFTVSGLASGVYQVKTPTGASMCRCWAHGTAPPRAGHELLVVADERIARGQRPLADALFSTPTLLVLMIAAAIVIPIAVHNSKDAS